MKRANHEPKRNNIPKGNIPPEKKVIEEPNRSDAKLRPSVEKKESEEPNSSGDGKVKKWREVVHSFAKQEKAQRISTDSKESSPRSQSNTPRTLNVSQLDKNDSSTSAAGDDVGKRGGKVENKPSTSTATPVGQEHPTATAADGKGTQQGFVSKLLARSYTGMRNLGTIRESKFKNWSREEIVDVLVAAGRSAKRTRRASDLPD